MSAKHRVVSGAPFCLAVLLALLLAGVLPARAAEVPADETGFTDYVAKAFSKALPGWKVRVVRPLMLDIEGPKNEGHDVHLDTSYSLCLRNPAVCEGAVQTFVGQMSATYKLGEVPPSRAALRAVIRPGAYVEQMRKGYASKGFGEPVAEPLIGNLWAVCAVDLPQAIQYMHPRDLKTLSLSRPQALELCKGNMAKALPSLAGEVKDLAPGEVGVIAGNPYESSRLLGPEDWGPFAAKAKGKLIIAVPATDVVLYLFHTDKKSVQRMRAAIDRVAAAVPRPLSPEVFRWTKKGWKVVPP